MGINTPNPDGCLLNLKWAEPWATRLTEGASDPMLNTLTAVPDALSPPQDEGGDAHDLQAELQRLARPDRVSLSSTTFLLHPWEAGVGMTVQMLVQPVLEALADGRTLFAPHLDIWADPVCAQRRTARPALLLASSSRTSALHSKRGTVRTYSRAPPTSNALRTTTRVPSST
eukprot:1096637-Prymnesium_polylepis.1